MGSRYLPKETGEEQLSGSEIINRLHITHPPHCSRVILERWRYRVPRRRKHHPRIYGRPFSIPFHRRVQYPQNRLFSWVNHLLGNRLCRQPFSKSPFQMNKRTTKGQTSLLVMTLRMSGMRLMKVAAVIKSAGDC